MSFKYKTISLQDVKVISDFYMAFFQIRWYEDAFILLIYKSKAPTHSSLII